MANERKAAVAVNDNNPYRFYVYAWQYPDGRTFYVGKGCRGRDVRPKRHNPIFKRIVAKIQRQGSEPRVVRWHDGLREEDAHRLEVAYIRLFGRRNTQTGVLANLTDGGEGGSGVVYSEEARANMSAAAAGKPKSAAHCAKIGDSKRGEAHPNFGKSLRAETRAKISAAHKGKTLSAEHRAKMSASISGEKHPNFGKSPSPETRAKISAAQIGKTLSVEHRLKMSVAMTGSSRSPETRAKISAALTGRPVSNETRAKIGAALSNPSDETRTKVSMARRMAPPRSVFKGVTFDKGCGKWDAKIAISGPQKRIGRFRTSEEAAMAYDRAAYAAWGDECYINFPDKLNRKSS